MLWLDQPWGYFDCKVPFSSNNQETGEQQKRFIIFTGPGNYLALLGPPSKVIVRTPRPGVLLLLGVEGIQGLAGLTLYW